MLSLVHKALMVPKLLVSLSTGPLIKIGKKSVRVDSSCPVAISSMDEADCGQSKKECLYDNDPK